MSQSVEIAANSEMEQFQVAVGAAETAFPTGSTVIQPEEIFVQAPSTNTLSVVVGKPGVLSDLSAGGFELVPGASMLLPINIVSKLKCIASAPGQKLLVSYMKGAN